MTHMARYSGVCPDCGERWQPGDLIRAETPTPDDLPEWRHAVCPDPLAEPIPARGRLGLWRPDEDLAAAIWEQVARG